MTRSEAERLTRIETLLETKLDDIANRLAKIEEHQSKQDEDAKLDREDLAALKNKGAGVLIGVGLLGGGIGAAVSGVLDKLLN